MANAIANITLPRLESLCDEAFRRAGLSAADAATGARVLSTTDAWGIFTHGSKALRGYLRRLLAGGLRANGQPAVTASGPSFALVDGDSALGMVTSVFAMQLAIAKARQTGTAYVGVHNSCHFGAAGYYAAMAAHNGLIGLAMANDIPSVAAPGSRGAVTGSNPFAYAVPAGRYQPLLLDMSVATVAGGKVYAARERGEAIPFGWLVDERGLPTDAADAYPEHATLTPAAGHKGYGLALLVESLSGALSGAAMTSGIRNWMGDDPALPTQHGAAFLAIDPQAIAPDLPARIADLIDEIRAAPKADGADRICVPGELEWDRQVAAREHGVALPPDVIASLREGTTLVGLHLDDYLMTPGASEELA